ncbi:DUF1003 domain-containing protein [Massilia litorea]|uniref:DUF1003 domain-containing protein n=1 Tax=Massilia litorea TaxID=2769491 RepID=A0A7L9U9P5_9BURK|nr:DUF1003 domain-containing protein [Massilia litorea]QOL50826.1 DUF1003 domain-containing protein [Massilia litorea]
MGEHDDDLTSRLPQSVNENLDTIAEYYARHEEKVTRAQAFVEKMSVFLGSPGYVATSVGVIVVWIAWNLGAFELHLQPFDPPPFSFLQGFITLNAFIISTTVLIRQNRMSKLAERNAHLDLQISLLSEEKISKIIAMLEEIRRDSPTLPDKIDEEADELAESADTSTVLEAIERDQEQDGARPS